MKKTTTGQPKETAAQASRPDVCDMRCRSCRRTMCTGAAALDREAK